MSTSRHRKSIETWLRFGFTAAVVLSLFRSLSTTVADPDLWGYLSFGRLFWEGKGFPYQDVFSYVPTLDPWVYHEWLTGVLFYPVYVHLGEWALQLIKYALGCSTIALLYRTARMQGAEPVAAWFLLFAVQGFLSLGYAPVRAQVFTYFFFSLSLYLLELAQHKGTWRMLFILAPLHIVWCNLHGGFVSGLGLIGLYAGAQFLSRKPFVPLVLVFLLCSLSTAVNPYGLNYWEYMVKAIAMPRPEITEWASVLKSYRTDLLSGTEALYVVVVVVFAGLLTLWARWKDLTGGLVTALTLYLGVRHVRHLVFFFIVAAVYLPGLLTLYLNVLRSRPTFMAFWNRWGVKIAALAVAGLAVGSIYKISARPNPFSLEFPLCPHQKTGKGFYYPVKAIDYIEGHGLSGKLLTDFNWGEYAMWRLYPRCKVAIDGRYETVYPPEIQRAYFEFLYKRSDWDRFLEDYPPDMILIDKKREVYGSLATSNQWKEVFSDCASALFERSTGH